MNSAPLSILGGNATDMGYHYLSKADLAHTESETYCDVNMPIMHHSIESFNAEVKSKIRDIINRKYNIILTGLTEKSSSTKVLDIFCQYRYDSDKIDRAGKTGGQVAQPVFLNGNYG